MKCDGDDGRCNMQPPTDDDDDAVFLYWYHKDEFRAGLANGIKDY